MYSAYGDLAEILMLMKSAATTLDGADHVRCLQSQSAELYFIPRVLPAVVRHCQNFLLLGVAPGNPRSADMYLYGDSLTGRQVLAAATFIHLSAMESCGYGSLENILQTMAFPAWIRGAAD